MYEEALGLSVINQGEHFDINGDDDTLLIYTLQAADGGMVIAAKNNSLNQVASIRLDFSDSVGKDQSVFIPALSEDEAVLAPGGGHAILQAVAPAALGDESWDLGQYRIQDSWIPENTVDDILRQQKQRKAAAYAANKKEANRLKPGSDIESGEVGMERVQGDLSLEGNIDEKGNTDGVTESLPLPPESASTESADAVAATATTDAAVVEDETLAVESPSSADSSQPPAPPAPPAPPGTVAVVDSEAPIEGQSEPEYESSMAPEATPSAAASSSTDATSDSTVADIITLAAGSTDNANVSSTAADSSSETKATAGAIVDPATQPSPTPVPLSEPAPAPLAPLAPSAQPTPSSAAPAQPYYKSEAFKSTDLRKGAPPPTGGCCSIA